MTLVSDTTTWERCHIGSCLHHRKCQYTPCRAFYLGHLKDVPAPVRQCPSREAKLEEAFKDALAALVGAVSAYERFAGNSKRAGVRDALYKTRMSDYNKAVERARNSYAELFGDR